MFVGKGKGLLERNNQTTFPVASVLFPSFGMQKGIILPVNRERLPSY